MSPLRPRHTVVIALLLGHAATAHAHAQAPDPFRSYFTPEAGPVPSPIVGDAAITFFHACPNNDGGSSLPNNARIRVVLRDAAGAPIAGVDPADVCILFNKGTWAQGFTGAGADSIIANGVYNAAPLCPDVRCLTADAPTDLNGATYITFAGASASAPGVSARNPNRKWGHYDSELPVYALGVQLPGRLTASDFSGSYELRIKSFDHVDGLDPTQDEGETVGPSDFNLVANHLGDPGPLSYWRDFDTSGLVGPEDFNMVTYHSTHDCDTPRDDDCGSAAVARAIAAARVSAAAGGGTRRCGTAPRSASPQAPGPGTVGAWIAERRLAAGGPIPVRFHVITCGAAGDVSDAVLDQTIVILNRHFSGRDYAGNRVPGADSTGYAFVKAGVTRTENAAWFTMTPGSTSEAEAKWALSEDTAGSLNIYVCEAGDGYLGWSSFPWDLASHPALDGIVLHRGTLPGGNIPPFNLGGVATHEAGHWMGLFHTFEGGCHADAACASAGDLVCDTPAQGTPSEGCPGAKDSCPAFTGLDDVRNYMDYSDDACYTHFTMGQDQRMDAMMAAYRTGLGAARLVSAR